MTDRAKWTPMMVADEYLAADWPARRDAVAPVRDFVSWLMQRGWTLRVEQAPDAGVVRSPSEEAK